MRNFINILGPLLYTIRRSSKYFYSSAVKVLCFHDIKKHQVNNFNNLISNINKYYGFISPADFIKFLDGSITVDGIKVLISFDDGYKSSFIITQQLLVPNSIKAIYFICPSFNEIKGRKEEKKFISYNLFNGTLNISAIDNNMAPMSWQDLRVLVDEGHLIGAHTMNHRILTNIEDAIDLESELAQNKKLISDKLSIEVDHFAFPYGHIDCINNSAMNLIKKHFRYCYSCIRGLNYSTTNNFTILRDPISLDMSWGGQQFFIENGANILYKEKIRKLVSLATNNGAAK